MKWLVLTICIVVASADDYQHFPEINKSFKIHGDVQTWANANEVCKKENATLAMPANAIEINILNDLFNTHYPASSISVLTDPNILLLGFHDIFDEGLYITTKGKSIQYYFHTWADGQPDDHSDEDCGSMHRDGNLNDFDCDIPSLFACEKIDSVQDDSGINVCGTSDPAYRLGPGLNSCYKFHTNPRKWGVAREICEAEGGHLAVIKNEQEEKHLVDIFMNPDNRVLYTKAPDYALIGFHDRYQDGHYVTVKDENLDDLGYVNWSDKRIKNASSDENCGSIHTSGGISEFPCKLSSVFICQRPANLINVKDQ